MISEHAAVIVREARRLETPFAANDYNGRPARSGSDFTWLVGRDGILLSAPHSINHTRDGQLKLADQFTGALVRAVRRLTGRPAIVRTSGPAGDPNWDLGGAYKAAIQAAAERRELAAVVDIHGAARHHPFDVAIGSAGVGGDWVQESAEVLRRHGLTEVMVDGRIFTASHPGTITAFVAHRLGRPALQIEINNYFRTPERRPEPYQQAILALAALTDFLHERFA